jgi:hypothetical protein
MPMFRGAGAGPRGAHRRGPRRPRRAPSRAAGVRPPPRPAVRLLHARFLMLLAGALDEDPAVDDARLREIVSSNLCRCTATARSSPPPRRRRRLAGRSGGRGRRGLAGHKRKRKEDRLDGPGDPGCVAGEGWRPRSRSGSAGCGRWSAAGGLVEERHVVEADDADVLGASQPSVVHDVRSSPARSGSLPAITAVEPRVALDQLGHRERALLLGPGLGDDDEVRVGVQA